jgi:hypothetical protein
MVMTLHQPRWLDCLDNWKTKCESPITIKNIIHLGQRSPKVWGPRLQPIEPIGKSGTVGYPLWSTVKLCVLYSVGLCHGKRFRCDVYVCSKIGYHGQVLHWTFTLGFPIIKAIESSRLVKRHSHQLLYSLFPQLQRVIFHYSLLLSVLLSLYVVDNTKFHRKIVFQTSP